MAYSSGAIVTLEAVASGCHVFAGWSGDVSVADSLLQLTMDRDWEIQADFIEVSPFPDVDCGYWACEHIAACAHAGIVSGYDDGLYHPDWPVTRDQMAAYISRALAGGDEHVPAPTGDPTFVDVLTDNWAYDYVEYAVEQSIVTGYGDGRYDPESVVTRDQMAVYIARALVTPSGEAALADYVPAAPRDFPDVASDFWAWKHIEYCVENDVVQGYPDGSYYPANVVSRDQMAVYIARAFELPL